MDLFYCLITHKKWWITEVKHPSLDLYNVHEINIPLTDDEQYNTSATQWYCNCHLYSLFAFVIYIYTSLPATHPPTGRIHYTANANLEKAGSYGWLTDSGGTCTDRGEGGGVHRAQCVHTQLPGRVVRSLVSREGGRRLSTRMCVDSFG